MTKQGFAEWAGRETIILDGTTGSNLIKAGLGCGVCKEQWIKEYSMPLRLHIIRFLVLRPDSNDSDNAEYFVSLQCEGWKLLLSSKKFWSP